VQVGGSSAERCCYRIPMSRVAALLLLGTLGCSGPADLGCDYAIPECVAVCGGPAVDNLPGGQCTCPPGTFFMAACRDGGADGDASK